MSLMCFKHNAISVHPSYPRQTESQGLQQCTDLLEWLKQSQIMSAVVAENSNDKSGILRQLI